MSEKPNRGPAYATRAEPNVLKINGKTVRAWVDRYSPPSSVGIVRQSRPFWTVQIDGVSRAGPLLDLERDNSPKALRVSLTQWANDHPQHFRPK